MKKFFLSFSLAEVVLWASSVLAIIVSFFVLKNDEYLYLITSLIGATLLILDAKGHFLGQFFTIVFAVLYAVISYKVAYYGEMITYLGMTGLIAVLSLISWIKNPSEESKNVVKVNVLSGKEYVFMFILSVAVSFGFYFVLKVLKTENLILSSVSVLTSFAASYLTLRRSKYYAFAYAINDAVLIALWSVVSAESVKYIAMVICFIVFLVNDLYGFISWHLREKIQCTKKIRKKT